MAKLASDSNGKGIQVVRPVSAVDYTDGNAPASAGDSVVRLLSVVGGAYGVNGAATVVLPAGAIEYIRLDNADVLTVSGTVNYSVCS
jgi:hypothetical protein